MDNKHNIIISLIAGVGILLFALVLRGDGEATYKLVNGDEKTITVQGEAERLVAPDTASVTFSMTRKDTNLSQATESVNQRIAEMITALDEFGIDEKDIKTTNYNVYPEYTYARNSGVRSFDGYRVDQALELTIRDLDNVEGVMTKIAELQVDNVSGLRFYVDEDQEIQDELRAEAITHAKEKAKQLGRELGVNLATIVGFSENGGGYYPQPMYKAAYDEMAMEDSVSAVIPVGENMMTANVSVTFEIAN